ncbi:hypothetical protein ACOMHN_066545 [Nucella lapillus]
MLTGFVYVSGYMSTLIAMERCLCIISPLKAQGMMSLKTLAVMIAVGHVVIFGGVYFAASKWIVVVFLREPSLVVSTDLVVSPEQKGRLMATLRNAGMTVTVHSTDLQA